VCFDLRGEVIAHGAGLKAVVAEIKERYACSMARAASVWGNAQLMGAWASARNVLGPFKSKGGPEAGDGQTPKAA